MLNLKGQTCTNGPGAYCGAVVEQWDSNADAIRRAQCIQGILKDAPAFGTEYDYVAGNMLLRVVGKVSPDEANKLNSTFGGTLTKAKT